MTSPSQKPHPLDGVIEPEAWSQHHLQPEQCALYSIAVSMKRIADVLDGTAAGLCVTETLLGGRRSYDQ